MASGCWSTRRRVVALVVAAILTSSASASRLRSLLKKQNLDRPALTEFGSTIRHVVMVSMGSGFCMTGRDDWRGELPRYLTHFLPQATTTVVNGRNKIDASNKCRPCLANIDNSGENRSAICGSSLQQKADLVLVFGSGSVREPLKECDPEADGWFKCAQSNYPSIRNVQRAKLMPETGSITVHFPVRKVAELFLNPFRFTHVVADDGYYKPVAYNTARMLSRCSQGPKTSDLLYVARYTSHKGQVEFVQRLDPALLGNHTLHFYGGENRSDYAQLLASEVERRGLNAVVHGRVSHDKLLDHVCRSSGQVHYALNDNNPRAAYEALFAGNPIFISHQSKTPKSFLELPFVTGSDADEAGNVNEDFRQFVEVLSRSWGNSITDHARASMNSYAVYRQICESIGVCAPVNRHAPRRSVSLASKSRLIIRGH